VDLLAFRSALSEFATGVAVVTARGRKGPIGVTINSFNSVSLTPPLVLFSLGGCLQSLPEFMAAEHFAINLLRREQEHISRQFARPQTDKWAGVAWTEGLGGAPLIDGSLMHFQCRAHARHPAGDHVIFIVEARNFSPPDATAEPLIFFRSVYSAIERGAEAARPPRGVH
jgi:flavin reductase (DIM6/NTAB) family NADH-FMN oxidoreductase RutF